MTDSALRLLVLTELFLPTKGGTAVWFDEVYRRLGGKEIHILTARVPGDDKHDHDHPNSIHRMKLERMAWMRPEALPLYLKFFGVGLVTGLYHSVDAVHAGRVLPEGLAGYYVARLLRRPLVVYAHGEEITSWLSTRRGPAMRKVYREANAVIANSNFTLGLLRELGVAEKRLYLIHPGVDLQRFSPHGPVTGMAGIENLHPGWPLVLSVGRLSKRKGFDQCIRAVARLKALGMDVDYVLVGIGEDETRLRSLIDIEGVADRVWMLGHVSMDDLPCWYRRADVFLMPNRDVEKDTEGFGMVFIEAAACGTPAIAGRAGGTGSAVLEGETGLRIDGEDLDALVKALHDLLTDRALLERLGRQALVRARREFSWDRVAERTRKIQESILATG